MAARRSRSRGLVRRWSAVRGWTSAPGRTSLTKAAESPTLAAYSRRMWLPSQGPARTQLDANRPSLQATTPLGNNLGIEALDPSCMVLHPKPSTQPLHPLTSCIPVPMQRLSEGEPGLLLIGTVGPTQ